MSGSGTIITPGVGSFTDSAGHVYTLAANGSAYEDGNAMAGGGGTAEMDYYGGVVYAQDAATGAWYTWNGSSFNGPVAAPPNVTVVTPPAGTTNWYQNPGQDGSFWKQPFQTTAQWITSGTSITQLRNGTKSSPTGYVHLVGDYSVPFYVGVATDPLCTVTDGTKTIQVRVPLGAVPEAPYQVATDSSMGGADTTQPYLIWGVSGTTITVNGAAATAVAASGTKITAAYGMSIDDGSGLVLCDAVTGQPGVENQLGRSILDFELTLANASASYVLQHMLQYALDPSQVSSTGPIWPLLAIDNSFPNTGGLAQGYTIGIPASTVRPTGQTRGFYLLFDNLQQFGWFYYNVSGNGCLSISCYQTSAANAALATDIANSISAVMAYVCILSNQSGLSSLKGYAAGGTNAFPAPPPLSYAPTNNVPVLPSSFGAWYPSGYNALSVPSTVTAALSIVTPTQQNAGSGFAVNGAIQGYASAPTLNYAVDGAAFAALPAGFSVTGTTFTFTCPGLAVGTHTLTVRDANNTSVSVATGSFSVVAVVQPVITPSQPSFPVAGAAYTVYGTEANYAAAPALTYADNGGVATALPGGSQVSPIAFSFLHPGVAVGTYTTVISDGTNQGSTASYAVTAVSGGTSANLTTVISTTTSFTDSAGNRWSISGSGLVAVNGVLDTTSSTVVELAWVNLVIWYKNAAGLWFSKTAAANAWSAGTSTSPLANLPTITISTVVAPQPNTAFTINGSLANYGALIPSLTYADTGGPATALPNGSSVSSTAFSFLHPGLPSGSYTTVISDGTTQGSISYSVIAAGWIALPASLALSQTITGLAASTPYNIEVYATNSVGQSAVSTVVSTTTLAAPGVLPSAPTALTSTAVTSTTVALSWTAPATGTTPFTYSTRQSLSGANTWVAGPVVSTTAAQFTGLTASTAYDFEVLATNATGSGPYSAIYTVSTTAASLGVVTFSPSAVSGPIVLSNANLTALTGGSFVVGGSGGSLIDGSGGVWTISELSSGGQAFLNGALPNGQFTANVSLLLLISNVVWIENTSGQWYTWSGTALVAQYTTPTIGSLSLVQSVQVTSAISSNVSFEVTLTNVTQNTAIALVTAAHTASSILGSDASSIAYYASTGTGSHPAQTMWLNGAQALTPSGNAPAADVNGAVLTFCVNYALSQWWVTGPSIQASYGAGAWNDSATASPATGIGGVPFAAMAGQQLWVTFGSQESGAKVILNAGATAFSRAASIPSTYPPLGGTSVVAVVPGAVTGLVAGTPSTNSVTLSWFAPTTGTTPFTYLVWQALVSGGAYAQVASVTTATTTITGLTAATAYDFKVQAANAAGTGAFSAVAVVTTATTITVPGAPSGLSAGTATSFSIPFAWQAPTTGSAPTGYQLQDKVATAGTYTNVSPTTTTPSETATGLAASTSYNAQVYAFNTAGSGPVSSPPVTASTIAVSTTGTLAQRAGDFFNMLCVQAQLGNSLYQTASYASDLTSIGARHFRSGTNISTSLNYILSDCYAAGITMLVSTPLAGGGNVINPAQMVTSINTFNSTIGSGFCYAVESINEPENTTVTYNGVVTGGGNDWSGVAQYTRDLYSTIASNFPGLPCFTISHSGGESNNVGMQWLTLPNPYPSGVIQAVAAGTVFGSHLNEHLYPFELQFYGTNINGGSNWNVSSTQTIDPVAGDQFQNNEHANYVTTWVGSFSGYSSMAPVVALPKAITEFGYRVNSPPATNGNDVDTATQGKCILTGMLNAWIKGYFIFSIYELYDPTGGYGIFNGANAPKTSGTYLRNFAAILNDLSSTNRTFAPGKLNYTASGLPAAPLGGFLLLQNAAGVFSLVLWQNARNWNQSAAAQVAVAAVTVTITLAQSYQIAVYDPTVGSSAISTTTATSVAVAVKDYPMVVTFH